MAEIVNISPKPSLLSPEEDEEIRVRSLETGRKIANALVSGVTGIVDAKAADQAAEIAALKERVTRLEGVIERLERAIAPREVAWTGE